MLALVIRQFGDPQLLESGGSPDTRACKRRGELLVAITRRLH